LNLPGEIERAVIKDKLSKASSNSALVRLDSLADISMIKYAVEEEAKLEDSQKQQVSVQTTTDRRTV
jgi:hypothetical protein